MSMGYDYLMVTRPERFMEELRKQLEAWDRKGTIGVSELRQAAGRVAWLAGVLPRARWVTSTLYAVPLLPRGRPVEWGGSREEGEAPRPTTKSFKFVFL